MSLVNQLENIAPPICIKVGCKNEAMLTIKSTSTHKSADEKLVVINHKYCKRHFKQYTTKRGKLPGMKVKSSNGVSAQRLDEMSQMIRTAKNAIKGGL